jgi:poly(3-hydroxybutyrate) depolymerase
MAAGGTAGASGTTTGGTTPSSGCGQSVDLTPGQWVEQAPLSIDNTQRDWSIWLPNNYDPERAYPLVVLLHGCGGITNNVPIQNSSGDDAILIRGAAAQSDNCWNTQESGPNDEFFDAMLDTAMEQMCIDSERVFAAGYSSGSWLMGLLNCIRADRLRAVGTVAGGNPIFGTPNCNGNVAAIFIHDQNDPENDISGSESVRDRLLEANGCSETSVASSPDPCVAYEGCQPDYPIHWCATSGEGHNRQDQFAGPAMWEFFSQF